MTPLQRYQADLERGGFQPDSAQRQAVEVLQALYSALVPGSGDIPWWQRLPFRRPPPLRGVYLWGGPGRGKTYLMDCFFDCLPVHKRRVHFHRFMLEIHQALDTLPKTPDPLVTIAAQLAARYRVLCLDEFHVTDIADAMLLSGLLDGLFRRGVVLVATSNTAPDELYRDGLQRQRFLPAIEHLKANTILVELRGTRDHRLERLEQSGTYRVLAGAQARVWLRACMRDLAPAQTQATATELKVAGRCLRACAVAEDIAWFSFEELCQGPRSVRDYLELAREFHTLLLEGVPHLGEELDEAARRFIHLVDALYDHGVKLLVTAATEPEHLYTGHRLKRAFQRTASRLAEMSGTAYLARPHRAD